MQDGLLGNPCSGSVGLFPGNLAARSQAFAAAKVGSKCCLLQAIAVQHVLPPGEEEPWFEANALPLRWQVPIGVLYDLLTDGEDRPWSLTVSPSQQLVGPLRAETHEWCCTWICHTHAVSRCISGVSQPLHYRGGAEQPA